MYNNNNQKKLHYVFKPLLIYGFVILVWIYVITFLFKLASLNININYNF